MIGPDQLEFQLQTAFEICQVTPHDRADLLAYLNLLMAKDPITRLHGQHSIRVGLKGREIADFIHLDQKALLFAGLTHDLGKLQVPSETLGKTCGWNEEDAQLIQAHVMDGYRMIRGRFDFAADTMVLHHAFQVNGYPKELPPQLHPYSAPTQELIREYGRILSLADVYDALHRENDKFGGKKQLTDPEIRQQMLTINPDREVLIEDLYRAGIFV